jgi:alpha-N-arabinofuranosidase
MPFSSSVETEITTSDVHRLLRFQPTESPVSTIIIDDHEGGTPVPEAILGNFFEHMSYATIGGASAEMLLNPTMSRRHFLEKWQIEELRANARSIADCHLSGGDPKALDAHWAESPLAGGFGVTIFDDESSSGIPLGWAAIGAPGSAQAAVGRLGGAVRLSGGQPYPESTPSRPVSLDSGPSGIRQAVFPPIHRTTRLQVQAFVRGTSEGSGTLEVGIRRRFDASALHSPAGTVLASAETAVAGLAWRKIELTLELEDDVVARREPVDFFLRFAAPAGTDLLVDRVSVMPDDHMHGFDPDVVALTKKSVPELRWPGGNFASFYHWRDGIGPVENRPTTENRAWGGLEFNTIGTDEYIQLCRMTGAEPHITVNSGTAWEDEAADWVEYCNGDRSTRMGALRAANGNPEPYNVRIWEVGNENFGEWQGGNVGSEENARRFAKFATAMRDASPIPLRILACGNWFDFADPSPAYDNVTADNQWHAELVKQAPNDIDSISLHSLPLNDLMFDGCTDVEVNESLLGQVVTGERIFLPHLLRQCDESARDAQRAPIEVAITEWGPLGMAPGRLMIENFGGVLWGATFLNFVVRNSDRVTMTSPNGYLHGGAIKKGAGVVYPDPQFEMIQLYRPFVGATPLRSNLAGPSYDVTRKADLGAAESEIPYVDVVAARTAAGTHAIVLANRHETKHMPVALSIDGLRVTRATSTSFSASAVGDRADPVRPDRFAISSSPIVPSDGALEITLEPHQVLWLEVETTDSQTEEGTAS